MPTKTTERILLLLILLAATLLRFWNLGTDSITHDELSALFRLQHSSLWEAIKAVGADGDGHPVGVQAFLYCWTNWIGDSSFVLRFPFALAGVLAVYFLYLLGRLFTPATGLLAATCLAVLEYPIVYSQLARPYSFGLLFTIAGAYFLFKHIQQVKQGISGNLSLLLCLLSIILCCYTHYFALMQVGLLALAGCWLLPKQHLKKYLLSLAIVPLLFLPHIGIFIQQFSQQGLEWLGAPTSGFLLEFIWYAFNYTWWFLAIIVLVVTATVLLSKKSAPLLKERIIFVLLFLVPFLVGFCYSIWVKPVLQFSLLLFSFPFLLLFVFSFSVNWKPKMAMGLTILLLITGTFSTVVGNQFFRKNHFAVYKELAEKTYQWNDELGEDSITRVLNVGKPFFINYYFQQKEKKKPEVKTYDINAKEELQKMQSIIEESNTPYFMYGWSNGYHPQEILQLIQEKYPYLVYKEWYFNSEVYLFGKKAVEPDMEMTELYSSHCLADGNCENWSGTNSDTNFCFTKNVEFGPTFQMSLNNWIPNEFNILTMTVKAETPPDFKDATLVLSFDADGKNLAWKSTVFSNYNIEYDENTFYISHRLPPEVWEEIENTTVKAYLWNNHQQQFCINSLEFKIEKGNPIVYDKYYVPDFK